MKLLSSSSSRKLNWCEHTNRKYLQHSAEFSCFSLQSIFMLDFLSGLSRTTLDAILDWNTTRVGRG